MRGKEKGRPRKPGGKGMRQGRDGSPTHHIPELNSSLLPTRTPAQLVTVGKFWETEVNLFITAAEDPNTRGSRNPAAEAESTRVRVRSRNTN